MSTTFPARAAVAAAAAVILAGPGLARADDSPLAQVRAHVSTISDLYREMPRREDIVVVIDRPGGSEDRASGEAVLSRLVLVATELRALLSESATFSVAAQTETSQGLIALVGRVGEAHEAAIGGGLTVDSYRANLHRVTLQLEVKVLHMIETIHEFRKRTSQQRRQDRDDSPDGDVSRAHWRELWVRAIARQVTDLRQLQRELDQLAHHVDQAAVDAHARVRNYHGDDDVRSELARIDGLIDRARERLRAAEAKETEYERKIDELRARVRAETEDTARRKRLELELKGYVGKLEAQWKVQQIATEAIAKLTSQADKHRGVGGDRNLRLDALQAAAAAWQGEKP